MATHQFTIGDITCTVVSDGRVPITDVTKTFPDAPKENVLLAIANSGQDAGSLWNHFNCLLINTGGENLLVDTGSGDGAREGVGDLYDALAEVGVGMEQIDAVFLTHYHGDHINGLVRADGSLAFPNARYITAEDEWNGWMSDDALANMDSARADALKAKLLPIKDKLTMVGYDEEIVPGVTTVSATGHTPGHTALLIESNGEKLMHLVDTAHRVFQLRNPDWSPYFDSQPDISPKTRHALLARVADENLLTLFYHFPFPGIGHVVRDSDVYRWEAV